LKKGLEDRDPFPYRVKFAPGYPPQPVPSNWLEATTPERLLKEGFGKVDEETYRMDFSGVIELRFYLRDKEPKSWDWKMNLPEFTIMVDELESIKMYIDRKADKISKSLKDCHGMGPDEGRKHSEKVYDEIPAVCESVHEKKAAFLRKYELLMDFLGYVKVPIPYPRSIHFFFDPCKTTKELDLYLRFVRLSMFVFWRLGRSQYEGNLTVDQIKAAIISYFLVLFTIKKIRRLYNSDVPLEALKVQFNMVDEQTVDQIVRYPDRGKDWFHSAERIAGDLVAPRFNTTGGNLKQIRKREKQYARAVRKRIGSMEDVELALSGKVDVPVPHWWMLRTEFGTEDQWKEQWRRVIASTIISPDPTPSPQRG
jgi:hypothetical protein